MTDDRRHCRTCTKLRGRRCEARGVFVMDDFPRRCKSYSPKPGEADQRTGRQLHGWISDNGLTQ